VNLIVSFERLAAVGFNFLVHVEEFMTVVGSF